MFHLILTQRSPGAPEGGCVPKPSQAKKTAKTSKNQPPLVPANLLDVNPQYAHVRLASGIETNVNIQGIAPHHEPVDENWS